MDELREILKENQRLQAAVARIIAKQPPWMTLEEVAQATQYSIATIKKYCKSGRVHPRCGRRMGNAWRFRREIIESEGLLFTNGETTSK